MDLMRPRGSFLEKGLLDLISILPNNITMIEIGCFAGESTLKFLNSGKVRLLYAIDAWQNGLDKADEATTLFDLVKVERCFDAAVLGHNVRKIKGNSLDLSSEFQDSSIDFIYLDSCHIYEHISKEIKLYYPKLKPSGLLGGHDYAKGTGVFVAVNEIFGRPMWFFKDTSWLLQKRGINGTVVG